MTDTNRPIAVLAVDDHPLLREGLAAVISNEPDMAVVAQAENGRSAIEQFRLHRPDITLMDLRLPDMNGVEAISAIRAECSNAKIIVLTTYKQDVQILRAVERAPWDFC